MTVLEDLRAQPLLAELPEERLALLAGQVTDRTLAPGELLYDEDDELRAFVLLAAGRLSTVAFLDDGPLDAGFEHAAPTFLGASSC